MYIVALGFNESGYLNSAVYFAMEVPPVIGETEPSSYPLNAIISRPSSWKPVRPDPPR